MRAARLVLLLPLALLACEPEHDPDRPGPPRVVHAYVVEATYHADGTASYLGLLTDPSFNPTDPDVWRKLPDLAQGGGAGPYAPTTLLRTVLSELLEGDTLEDLVPGADGEAEATLRPGIIAVTAQPRSATVMPLPGAAEPAQASYFDPSGSDTTGPPGPALVMAPKPALPAGSIVTVTLSGAAIKDTRGNPMAADASFSFETKDVAPLTINSSLLPDGTEPIEVAAENAIEIGWNTLLAPGTVTAAAFELRGPLADPMPAVVPVGVSFEMAVVEALGGVPAVEIKPTAPLTVGATYALVLRAAVTDLYGMPLPADVTLTLLAK